MYIYVGVGIDSGLRTPDSFDVFLAWILTLFSFLGWKSYIYELVCHPLLEKVFCNAVVLVAPTVRSKTWTNKRTLTFLFHPPSLSERV